MAKTKTKTRTGPALTLVEKAERIQPFAERGVTGLKQWMGIVDEEFVLDLKGTKEVKVYREMRDNSPVVGAMLFAIEQLLRGVSLRVQAGTDDQQGQRAKELVETGLDDMSSTWGDTLTEILTMLPYGWSWLEVVYKRRQGDQRDPKRRSRYTDGLIGWRKMALRSQDSLDRFEFDEAGGVQAMQQWPPAGGTAISLPIEKSLLFRTQAVKNNPRGRSVLRNAYLPYYYSKRIQTVEAIGIERDLAGLPVAYAPPEVVNAKSGSTEETVKTSLKDLVTNIRRDEQEGIVFPLAYDSEGREVYKLALLSTGGRRQFDTGAVIERYERRIAMTVLADFILLGHEKVGSFALSSSKTDLFAVALSGWMDAILAVLNRHEIPRILRLNGMPVVNPPWIEHGDMESPDLAELGEYVQRLAGAGLLMFPSDDGSLERSLLDAAGLPPGSFGEGQVGKRNAEWLAMIGDAAHELRDTVREIRKADAS